jgi:hypothetical protein
MFLMRVQKKRGVWIERLNQLRKHLQNPKHNVGGYVDSKAILRKSQTEMRSMLLDSGRKVSLV